MNWIYRYYTDITDLWYPQDPKLCMLCYRIESEIGDAIRSQSAKLRTTCPCRCENILAPRRGPEHLYVIPQQNRTAGHRPRLEVSCFFFLRRCIQYDISAWYQHDISMIDCTVSQCFIYVPDMFQRKKSHSWPITGSHILAALAIDALSLVDGRTASGQRWKAHVVALENRRWTASHRFGHWNLSCHKNKRVFQPFAPRFCMLIWFSAGAQVASIITTNQHQEGLGHHHQIPNVTSCNINAFASKHLKLHPGLQLGVQVGIYIQVRIHAQRSMERRQRQIKWVSKESYDLWLLSSAHFMHHLCVELSVGLFLWLLGLPLCQWCHSGHAVWAKSQASMCQWCSHCIQISGKLPFLTYLRYLQIMILFSASKRVKDPWVLPPRPWNWWNPAL